MNIAASASRPFASLEAGRGVAALLVLALHTGDHCAAAYGPFALGELLAFGHAGVDFFFVLSGFIILHVHGRDIGRPARLAHYAGRRVTRIYPLYWVAMALAVAARVIGGHGFPGAGELATSALLLPTLAAPTLDVAWTLQREVVFYAVFALLILNRRLGQAMLAAWFAIVVAYAMRVPAVVALAAEWGLVNKLASFFDIEFFLGMAVAWICGRGSVPQPGAVLLGGVAAFAAIGLAEDAGSIKGAADLTHLGYGLASSLVVLGLVGAERAGMLAVPRVFAMLGGASYSIYLTHLLAIGAAWQGLLALGLAPLLPGWAAFLLLAAAATATGFAISIAIERPLIALVRRRLTTARAPAAAVAP